MKKKKLAVFLTVFLTGASAALAPASETGTSTEETAASEYEVSQEQIEEARKLDTSKTADASDMIETEQVGDEEQKPVTGDELNDGTYDIKVESSSAMFNIDSCTVTVSDGAITADLTMGGTGYLFLYPGTAQEAASADAEDFIYPEENAEGKMVFMEFPVEALDEKVQCAAFSKKREQWYPRTLDFRSTSLPPEAFKEGGESSGSSTSDLADGTYTAEVRLEGGSVSAVSPMELTVEGGQAVGKLVLDTSKADYVKVDDEKIEADPEESGSDQTVFRIPVPSLDRAFAVVIDSTAIAGMNVEKDYSLTVDSSTLQEK